jgi:hypothetical protein
MIQILPLWLHRCKQFTQHERRSFSHRVSPWISSVCHALAAKALPEAHAQHEVRPHRLWLVVVQKDGLPEALIYTLVNDDDVCLSLIIQHNFVDISYSHIEYQIYKYIYTHRYYIYTYIGLLMIS